MKAIATVSIPFTAFEVRVYRSESPVPHVGGVRQHCLELSVWRTV